jgi:hypothetical protein
MSKHMTAADDSPQSPSVVALKKTEVTGVDKSGKRVKLEETVLIAPTATKP